MRPLSWIFGEAAAAKTDAARLQKVKYLEEQMALNLKDRLDSLNAVIEDARKVLNWLFTLVIASGGYALTEIRHNQWWLALPLLIATLGAACQVRTLIHIVLQYGENDVPAQGNEWNNFREADSLSEEEVEVRLSHFDSYQDRINEVIAITSVKVAAVDHARLSLMHIPLLTLMTTGVFLLVMLIEGAPFSVWSSF